MIVSKRIDLKRDLGDYICEKKINNIITIVFAAVDSRQQENKERSQKDIFERRRLDKMIVFSMEDWEKTIIEEVKMRWGKRRRKIAEVEKKKMDREKKIEEIRKKKEEKRRRAIRERRCFVCGIFGHMACYCRNRGEKKGSTQMPSNKFEVLKDRVMQRGERSGKETVKERREILREEREKKIKEEKKEKRKTKVQKKDLENKKEKKIDDEKEKIEKKKEVEIRGFSRGEILRGRYPLAWRKVWCHECGGLGYKKRDHREKMKKIEKAEEKEVEKKSEKEEKKIEEMKKSKEKKKKEKMTKKEKKKKIEKREKRDVEIATVSRSKKVNLIYFIFLSIFIFFLIYFSIFLFLEQLGLGLICHAVTSVTT